MGMSCPSACRPARHFLGFFFAALLFVADELLTAFEDRFVSAADLPAMGVSALVMVFFDAGFAFAVDLAPADLACRLRS